MGEPLGGVSAGRGRSTRRKGGTAGRRWRSFSPCGLLTSPRVRCFRVSSPCWSSALIKVGLYNRSSAFSSRHARATPALSSKVRASCTRALAVPPLPSRRPSPVSFSRSSGVLSELSPSSRAGASSRQSGPPHSPAPPLGLGVRSSLSSHSRRPTRLPPVFSCPLTTCVLAASCSSRQRPPSVLSRHFFRSSAASWRGSGTCSAGVSSLPAPSRVPSSGPVHTPSLPCSASSVTPSTPSCLAGPSLLPSRPSGLSGLLHPRLQPSYLSSLSPLAAKWLLSLSSFLELLPPPTLRLWGGSSCEIRPKLLPPPFPLRPLLQAVSAAPLQALRSSLLSFGAPSDASSSSLPSLRENCEALRTRLLLPLPTLSASASERRQESKEATLIPWNLSYSLQNTLHFSHLLPLQQTLLPFLLSSAYDLHVVSRSGTGKSIAVQLAVSLRLFDDAATSTSLPPESISDALYSPFCIFLVPTRDLAVQTADQLHNLLRYSPFRVALLTGGRGFLDASHHARHAREWSLYHPRSEEKPDEGSCPLPASSSSVGDGPDEGNGSSLQGRFEFDQETEGLVFDRGPPVRWTEGAHAEEIERRATTWKLPGRTEERSWRSFDWLEQQRAHVWVCTPGRLEEYLAFHEWRESTRERQGQPTAGCEREGAPSLRARQEPGQKEDLHERSSWNEEELYRKQETCSLRPTSSVELLRNASLLVVEESAITLQDGPGQRSLATLLRLKEQLRPDHQTIFLSTSISPDLRALVSRLCRVRNLTINALDSPSLPSLSLSPLDGSPSSSAASHSETSSASSVQKGEKVKQAPSSVVFPNTQPTPDNSTEDSRVSVSSPTVSSFSTSPRHVVPQELSEKRSTTGVSRDAAKGPGNEVEKAGKEVHVQGEGVRPSSSSLLPLCFPATRVEDKTSVEAFSVSGERENVRRQQEKPAAGASQAQMKERSRCILPSSSFQEDILSAADGVGLWGPKRASEFLEKKRRQFFFEKKRFRQSVVADSGGYHSRLACQARDRGVRTAGGSEAREREEEGAGLPGKWEAAETERSLSSSECVQSEFAIYPAEMHAHVVLNAMLSETRRATLVRRSEEKEEGRQKRRSSEEQSGQENEAPSTAAAREEGEVWEEPEEQEQKHTPPTPQSPVVRGLLFFSCLKTLQFHYVFFKHFFFSSLRATGKLGRRVDSPDCFASSSSSANSRGESSSSTLSSCLSAEPLTSSAFFFSSFSAADDNPPRAPPIPRRLPRLYALHHGLTPERRRAAVQAFADRPARPRFSSSSPRLRHLPFSRGIPRDDNPCVSCTGAENPSVSCSSVRAAQFEDRTEKEKSIEEEDRDSHADVRILFATDIASAGLDLGTVDFIIHVGIPRDVEHFIQRLTRITRPPPARSFFPPLLADSFFKCPEGSHSTASIAVSTSSPGPEGAGATPQRQASCSSRSRSPADRPNRQGKEEERITGKSECLAEMLHTSNTLATFAENIGQRRLEEHPGRSLLLLHDLDCHFLYQAYDANVSLKETSPRNALEILQPHPALSGLLPSRSVQRPQALDGEAGRKDGMTKEKEKRGRRKKGKRKAEQDCVKMEDNRSCRSLDERAEEKEERKLEAVTLETNELKEASERPATSEEGDLLASCVASEHGRNSPPCSCPSPFSLPSLPSGHEPQSGSTKTEDASARLGRETEEPPLADSASLTGFSNYLCAEGRVKKGIEDIPVLFASCELMYRNLLGFYALQASKLKFERWQVPSLVNALLSSFGVSTPPPVTKQFAARLKILNAPGLTVDYWATPRTELLANLAAYPGFQSRMREISLTGGIRNSPVLRLSASEQRQMFLDKLEKRKGQTTRSVEGRSSSSSSCRPSVRPSSEVRTRDQSSAVREERGEERGREEERDGLEPQQEASSTCTSKELGQYSLDGDYPMEPEQEDKSTSKIPRDRNNPYLDDAYEHEDEIVWLSLSPPPVPLHLVPGGRELQNEDAARREKERERKRTKKGTIVHITAGKSRTA